MGNTPEGAILVWSLHWGRSRLINDFDWLRQQFHTSSQETVGEGNEPQEITDLLDLEYMYDGISDMRRLYNDKDSSFEHNSYSPNDISGGADEFKLLRNRYALWRLEKYTNSLFVSHLKNFKIQTSIWTVLVADKYKVRNG